MRHLLHGLYAITEQTLLAGYMMQAVEQALQGGANVVQYRDKSIDPVKREQQAKAIVKLCTQYNRLCIINDDIELALKVKAHGLHIGADDIDLTHARNRLGKQTIIGVSCYNSLALAKAAEQHADYVAFGSVFPTLVKPDAPVASPSLLRQACQQLRVPVVAIGGIKHHNAKKIIACGIQMVAVIHGVFDQNDIKSSAQTFTDMFQ